MNKVSKRTSRCVLCAVALGVIAAVAQAQEKSHDALATARAKALAENQRVLLLLAGGDEAIGTALAAAMTATLSKPLLYECQVVALPADSLAGKALRERLKLGDLALPALALLTTDDEVLATLDAQRMTKDGVLAPETVRTLVEKHACAPLDARAVLAAGLATAKKSKRHAFVYLSAPWCGWCHRLGVFLGHQNVSPRFAQDYVTIVIDTERMTGGEDLAEELRGGADGGIPWIVILDGDGQPKITSDGPQGNIGCPAEPHEIDHFLAMLDATRQHMSDEDRAVIERELREFGAGLVGPRSDSPGRAAYVEAVAAVKAGRFGDAVRDLRRACEAGFAFEKILSDPSLRPLREDAERRLELLELSKEKATGSHIEMVDRTEPGRRIRLEGQVVDMATGEALPGALVQVFHTDANGEYRPGMDAGGGAGNPRLFGYLRADGEGRFTVDTIMPERYPNSSVPRHVHYRVWAANHPVLESECFFDSDPNLSQSARQSAPQRNFPIVTLRLGDDKRWVGALSVRVPG